MSKFLFSINEPRIRLLSLQANLFSIFFSNFFDATVLVNEVPGRVLHSHNVSVPQGYSQEINIALAS